MRTTIIGVRYDTESDPQIGPFGEFKGDGSEQCLRRTPSGRYYVHNSIPQVLANHEWQNDGTPSRSMDSREERRLLETVRPLHPHEVRKWFLRTVAPPEIFHACVNCQHCKACDGAVERVAYVLPTE